MSGFHGTEEHDDSESSRRRFAAAKDSMKQIYEDDILTIIQRMLDIANNYYFPSYSTDWKTKLEDIKDKVNRILKVISRRKMKAVVFGMTSSGKSALINALLRDNVLPSLCGETTAGFVEIEGTDKKHDYAEINLDGFTEPITMEDFRLRCNMLHTGKMHTEEIRIYWPKDKCNLLRHELTIVDCPGTCTTSATDKQVRTFCEDADIHVFVVSAVSTLNEASRNFFKDVAKCLSKPNILIVYTWWDYGQMTMSDIDQERVAIQHKERATTLLKDDLNVIESQEEARDRIFLTSPVEILKEDKASLPKKWEERQIEFDRFERTFNDSVSDSAIKTKFKGHCEEGERIADDAVSSLDDMQTQLEHNKMESEVSLGRIKRELQAFRRDKKEFVKGSELFVEMSNKRITEEKSKSAADATKNDIDKNLQVEDGCELDENNVDSFAQELHKKVENLTEHLKEDFKSIIDHEQGSIKAEVSDLFQKLFPNLKISLPSLQENETDSVHIDYRDMKDAVLYDVDVGYMQKCLGSGRNALNSTAAAVTGTLGAAASVVKAAASGYMWYTGVVYFGGAAFFGPAAVVVGGVTGLGYGVKKGLDWNNKRLRNNIRDKCVSNTVTWIENKHTEFTDRCTGVMERYSKNTIDPCLSMLEREEGRLKQEKCALITKIQGVSELMTKVEKIKKDVQNTRPSLHRFKENFIENKNAVGGQYIAKYALHIAKDVVYSVKDALTLPVGPKGKMLITEDGSEID